MLLVVWGTFAADTLASLSDICSDCSLHLASVLLLLPAAHAQPSLLEDDQQLDAVADEVSEDPGDAKVAPPKPGVACTETA